MIEYEAHVIGVVYRVNDCINAAVGHKIDPVVDGDLWMQLKTTCEGGVHKPKGGGRYTCVVDTLSISAPAFHL